MKDPLAHLAEAWTPPGAALQRYEYSHPSMVQRMNGATEASLLVVYQYHGLQSLNSVRVSVPL